MKDYGPGFGKCFQLKKDSEGGLCYTNGVEGSFFNIPTDEDGNSVLTGEGKG